MTSHSDGNRDPEHEYFLRLEQEKKDALRKQLEAEASTRAAEALKALHANHCGRCGGDLAPQPFKGVEIDVCGSCGAVLLDPGELEQLAGQDGAGFLTEMLSVFRRR